MKLRDFLEKEMIDESLPGIYGKKKSPMWLKLRDRIFSAKNNKDLTKLLKEMDKLYRSKKLDINSFLDLVDKVDVRKQKLSS